MANIRVNCTCGKVLKIPEKYAGKKGRCPNCGKKIRVPEVGDIKKTNIISRENMDIRNCPTCGAYLKLNDEICVSCNMNLKTGEWNSEGRRGTVSSPNKLHYLGVATMCILLIVGGIYIISQFQSKKKPLSSWPDNTIRNKVSDNGTPKLTAQELENLGANMKNTSAQVNPNKEEIARQAYQAVLQKNQEKKNAIMRWIHFKELAAKYQDTEYIRKINEQAPPLEDAIKLVQGKRKGLKSDFDEGKYAEVIEQGTGWLEQVVKQTYPEEELQRELREYVKICHDAALSYKELAIVSEKPKPKDQSKDDDLMILTEKCAMYMQDEEGQWETLESYYREKAKKWDFHTLAAQLAPLAIEAKTLREKHPNANLLARIAELYKEATTLQKFWQYVEKSLTTLQKQKKTVNLLLKTGSSEVVTGKITKYENGVIYLKTKKNKDNSTKFETEEYALVDISARGLVMLVSLTGEKRGEFYQTAVCFDYINNDPFECRSHCDNALDKGAMISDIGKYHQWALGEISKREEALAKSEAKKKEAETAQGEKKTAKGREKIIAKAWHIIETQLLPEYRRDNTKMIFKYLEVLQRTVPRDELIKLNSETEKKWGQSLYDIAHKALIYCTHCKDTGKVKCPSCKGDGFILYEKVLKSASTSSKKYCERCGGSGEIYCSKCYFKRHNRKYCMLVDYYDEID